jgi:hypothetical protein
MSSNRYLEFDSTYRNRILYPEPSEFTVEMSQSGQKAKLQALDPMSYASPILVWNNSFVEGGVSNLINGIAISPVGVPSEVGNTTFKISATGGATGLRQIKNFYSGSSIYTATGGGYVARRILDYTPLQYQAGTGSSALITVDSAIPDGFVGSSFPFTIANPTPLSTNSPSGSAIKFFIPAGSLGDNFYVNYKIENLNTFEIKTITYYDGATRLATLNSPTTADWLNSASTGYNFAIRYENPAYTGTFGATNSTTAYSLIGNTNASSETSYYVNSFIRISDVSLVNPPYSSPTGPYGEERRIVKYITGDGLVSSVSGGGTTIVLNSQTSSSVDSYYVGCIFYDSTTASSAIVTAYTGSTRTLTISPAIGGAGGGDVWSMRTAFIERPFSVSSSSLKYEMEYFTTDMCNPFTFSGSLTTTQEMVCYEVELLNLALPNSILTSGRGGRPIFYPYLYVELQQISASSAGNKGIICSNNPNSYRMLFRAVVDDTPIPVVSPFIKIDGDGMVHVIKFKPSDSFKFSVRHSDGELFKTVINDSTGPTERNPLAQISACFGFKRI